MTCEKLKIKIYIQSNLEHRRSASMSYVIIIEISKTCSLSADRSLSPDDEDSKNRDCPKFGLVWSHKPINYLVSFIIFRTHDKLFSSIYC